MAVQNPTTAEAKEAAINLRKELESSNKDFIALIQEAKTKEQNYKQFLTSNNIQKHQLEQLFSFSKVLYEFGEYHESEAILSSLIHLVEGSLEVKALFGLLHTQILTSNNKGAYETIKRLDRSLQDSGKLSKIELYTSRVTYISTSVFVMSHFPNPGKFMYELLT